MQEQAIHQVGPRYGIRDFERQIGGQYQPNEDRQIDKAFLLIRAEMLEKQKRKAPVSEMVKSIFEFIDVIKGDAWDAGITHIEPNRPRQPHEIILHSVYNAKWYRGGTIVETIKSIQGGQEVAIAAKDIQEHVFIHVMNRFLVTQKRMDHQMYSCGVGFHRHALERFYEREKIGTGKMLESIRCWMPNYINALSVAITAGIMTEQGTDLKDAPRDSLMQIIPFNRPALAIPCGSGLMMVQMSPTIHTGAQFNEVVAKQDIKLKSPTFHPGMHKSFDRHQSIINAMMAMTYVSGDLLRQEQEDYRQAFLEVMSGVEIEAIRTNAFAMRDPHRTESTWPAIDHPQIDFLRRTISEVVENKRREERGWDLLAF